MRVHAAAREGDGAAASAGAQANAADARVNVEAVHALARLASVQVDVAGGAVVHSHGTAAILGLARAPATLQDLLACMSPTSRVAFESAFAPGLDDAFELELELIVAGARHWVRTVGGAVEAGPQGTPMRTLVFQDITEFKEARDEVLRLNATLERRVTRRTRQLQAANRELEAFSYSVSHDLKAPLAAIDGFTHVLSERLKGKLDEREAGYMQRVRAGVANMFSLIEAMLALHQLSRDTPMDCAAIDVSAIAAAIVAELREQEPQRNCRIAVEPGMVMYGDRALVTIALRNLIGNAWKFSGGKDVTELQLALDPDAPPGFTSLRVTDRGAGFDGRHAHKLFAPFQRLHHAGEFPGTGVGLATVQRVVQRHGGTVRAEGAVGEGASFWLCLPQAPFDLTQCVRDED